MELAKDALDVGLMTDDPEMLAFFERDVGLGQPERLRVNRNVVQHRFDAAGSVVKVNLVAELPIRARSGYAGVVLGLPGLGEPRHLRGPDDVSVEIVRPGDRGVAQLGVRLQVPDLGAARSYFETCLGWEVADDAVRLGRSRVLLEQTPDAPTAVQGLVRGWTYLTVQVYSCDDETERAVKRGAALHRPPVTLGDVARFSMVADPWGNPLEISERRSLTGRPLGRPPGGSSA